jgi:hypothetical protein
VRANRHFFSPAFAVINSVKLGVNIVDLEKILATITPEVYANLQRAIELGKWADGQKLTVEQKELCMQAIIAYGEQNLAEEERTGFVNMSDEKKSKRDNEMNDIQTLDLK